jgi:hypothetical protein
MTSRYTAHFSSCAGWTERSIRQIIFFKAWITHLLVMSLRFVICPETHARAKPNVLLAITDDQQLALSPP